MRDDGRSREALLAEIAALCHRVAALEDQRTATATLLYGDPLGDAPPLLEQVPAVVWTTDRDLRLTWWAGGALDSLEMDTDSEIGGNIYSFFGSEDPKFAPIAAHRAALAGERTPYEFEFRRMFVTAHAAPLRNGSGEICGVIGIAIDITERRRAEQDRELLIVELREALRRVKTLSGLIPICMHCKNVRNDTGYWEQVETYVHDHSEAEFTHAICPECMDRELGRGDGN